MQDSKGYKIFLLVLFSISSIFLKAQSPPGLPLPNAPTAYYNLGWVREDSGHIFSNRQPNFTPLYPFTTIGYLRPGVDTALWLWTGQTWEEIGKSGGIASLTGVSPIVFRNDSILCPTCAVGGGITQLTGDGTAGPGSGSQPFTLNTVNATTGVFGSASSVGEFTANGKGLITLAGSVPIQIAESQVTNLVSDLASKQGTITLGSTSQYFRGDLSLATFPTNLSSFTNGPGFISTISGISAGGALTGTYPNPGLAATVTGGAGSCTNCNLSYNAAGQLLIVSNGSSGGAQNLTYTQLATNNTLSISGGNTQTFLTATGSLSGLLDTSRAKTIDSLRNRTFTWPVSSVSNSDGTLTISPTTGAVVASLNLAHGNTWVTNPQTFNGGVVLTNNLTYGTDNTYQLGTSSVGASHVWSRVFNSDAVASLSSASGNSANISIGATAGITLLSTGQAQFNNYTGSGFSATSNDSILTINPANGQIGWRWGQPFYIQAVQGLTPIGTTGDSIALGGMPFYQADTIKTAGFPFFVTGLPSKSTALSTDSVVIETLAGQLYKLPVPSGGGGSGTVTSVAQTVPTSLLSISGTPITTSGTLAIGLTNASALNVWGNSSGSTGAPGYFEPTSTIMNSWFGSTIQTQLSGTGYSKFTGTSVSYNPQIPLGTDVSGVLSVTQLGAQAVYPAPTQIGFEWNTPVNVGYVGSDLMNFTASGGPTLALSSGKINVTNTVTAWTAYVIDRLQHPTVLNDWIWTAVTQYTSPINAANVGYGPVYLSTKNGDNTGVSCYIRTTGSPTIIMNGTGGTPSLSTGTLHTISTNDLIRFTFQKIDSVIKLYVKDSTTGTLDSCVYTYSLTSGQPIIPNTGNFGFVSFNDNFSILGTSMYSTDTAYATGVLAGDSKFQGFRDTYFSNRPWVSLEANYPPFVQYSGQGDRVTDFINKWQEVQLLNPEYWIFELGSNDIRNSVPLATIEANVVKCYNLMSPKGSLTKVYFVVMPEDSTAGSSPGIGQTNYYNWLVANSGTSLMPNAAVISSIWTGLAGGTPGVLSASYNSGDNIHPNAAGAAVITADLLAYGLTHISVNRRTQISNEDPLVVTTGSTTHSIFSQLSMIPYRALVADTVGNLVPSTMRDNGSTVLFTKNYPATGPLPAGMPYGFDNGLGVYGPTGAFYFVDRVNAANNFALVSSNNVLVHTNNGNQIGFLSNTGAYLVGNTSGSPHFNSTLEINGSRTIPGFGYGAAFNLDSATYSLTTGGSPAFFSMFDLQHDSLIGASAGNSVTDLAKFSIDIDGLGAHMAATRTWAQYIKNGGLRTGAATTTSPSINIPAGTFPTSPNQGDLGAVTGHLYYRDQTTTYDLLSGATSPILFSQTAAGSTITSSSGSLFGTGVGTLTIPANTLQAGQTITIHGYALYSTAVVPGSLQFNPTLGGTGYSFNPTISPSITSQYMEFTMSWTVITTGSSGTLMGNYTVNTNGIAPTVGSQGTTTTVNTTSTIALGVTMSWPSYSSGDSFNSVVATVKIQ